jgi:hypothetical protein
MVNTLETLQENNSLEIWNKIDNLTEFKGQTPSSMITLVIPPKYCI